MDWSNGYRTEITYTHGYYTEINPAAMHFLLLAANITPPEITNACELGFGQGVSLNIHAAAEPVAWVGTDFNPAQVAFARNLAKASGARCLADSFHDFCKRDDLPLFDYIALHGIWSWISAENQRAIIRIIDKKLRAGGVVYISYNTSPGWASFKPARDLMARYAGTLPAERQEQKATDAFAFMEKLMGLKTGYGAANPQVIKRIEQFKGKDSAYLVHEFFNRDWQLSNFADLADSLAEARVSFACSAQPLFVSQGLGMTKEQLEFLNSIHDPVIRETVTDFIRNTQFRKDYWIKGARPLGSVARAAALRAEQVILLVKPDKIMPEFKTALGNAKLAPAMVQIVVEVLGDGHAHTLAELEKAAAELAQKPDAPDGAAKENIWTITQAVCILISAGLIANVQKKGDAQKARSATDRLNAIFENMAMQNGAVSFLASPVTGGGIQASRFEMLFLLALKRGVKTSQTMAGFARDCLNAAGQRILKDGKQLDGQDEMLAYLQNEADAFVSDRLPVFKNLLVA